MHHEHSAASAFWPTVTNVFITWISNGRRHRRACRWTFKSKSCRNTTFALMCNSFYFIPNAHHNNNNYPVVCVASYCRNRIWARGYHTHTHRFAIVRYFSFFSSFRFPQSGVETEMYRLVITTNNLCNVCNFLLMFIRIYGWWRPAAKGI